MTRLLLSCSRVCYRFSACFIHSLKDMHALYEMGIRKQPDVVTLVYIISIQKTSAVPFFPEKAKRSSIEHICQEVKSKNSQRNRHYDIQHRSTVLVCRYYRSGTRQAELTQPPYTCNKTAKRLTTHVILVGESVLMFIRYYMTIIHLLRHYAVR